MTLPSSATVVPAMSRQAVVNWLIGPSSPRRPSAAGHRGGRRSREALLSDSGRARHAPPAGAGHEDPPRRHLRAVVELARRHLAVDPRPPPPGARQGGAEELLGPAAQVIVGALVDVERERLVVLVGVADRPAALPPLP